MKRKGRWVSVENWKRVKVGDLLRCCRVTSMQKIRRGWREAIMLTPATAGEFWQVWRPARRTRRGMRR